MKKKYRVGKNFKIVKRSCSLNRYYRVLRFIWRTIDVSLIVVVKGLCFRLLGWRRTYKLSRDRGVCPGIFFAALVPGQRDKETFFPGTKGRPVPDCPGLSRDEYKLIQEFGFSQIQLKEVKIQPKLYNQAGILSVLVFSSNLQPTSWVCLYFVWPVKADNT
jgi:hypothetical protein